MSLKFYCYKSWKLGILSLLSLSYIITKLVYYKYIFRRKRKTVLVPHFKWRNFAITYPLILITKASLGSASTKKFPAALADLLASITDLLWVSYSLWYFSALANIWFLFSTLSFFSLTLLSWRSFNSLASLACFFLMFSGMTLHESYPMVYKIPWHCFCYYIFNN